VLTAAVLAAGAALVLALFAWSLCRAAAEADQHRCAWCGEPAPDRQLWCHPACQMLFMEDAP
jgi:hypothetical protein